ncbi:MAG: YdiU family protein [Wenzhouxiangellaceae bacterium]|nr:YdiU family protein [Wenzhouxiangellaceae bacterium]
MNIAFDNSYARLPPAFYQRQSPDPVGAPSLIVLNHELAAALGLDVEFLSSADGLNWLAGNRVLAGSEPLAMAYAGHQFGHFVPQLGDGRALLVGEVIDGNGQRRDLHMKGSGPTPFSRGGDGRASIGPVVREYLASEAMAALGVPTTRALAAVATGETVFRQQPEPGGILWRAAAGHVRVGTFEYFARRGQLEALRALADHVIARHYPDLAEADNPALALFDVVIDRTAALVAHWMSIGFIHGVMNTDNTSVAGETIDYGPFGFLDSFDPNTCYSSIDRHGRYAWQRQPTIAHWNLARLGECLLPLIDDDPQRALEHANSKLEAFPRRYQNHFNPRLTAKIGLDARTPEHIALALDLLERMHRQQADFTLTFRRLAELDPRSGRDDAAVRELFVDPDDFDAWAIEWRARLAVENRERNQFRAALQRVNPAFILRNHLAQRVADAAVERLDFEPLHTLLAVLARPYNDQPEHAELARPPRPEERVTETFCGT